MKNANCFLIFSALFPWACIVISTWMTPRLTRPDLFFSVTVKPDFRGTPEGAEILRGYSRIILIFAALGLLPLAFFFLSESWILAGILCPVAVELVGFFTAFILSRRRVMAFRIEPTAVREAGLAPRTVSLPGGWLGQAGPFLILLAVAVALGLRWDQIPARVPIHWGVEGKPDGWSAKSWVSIFYLPMIGLWVCMLICGISYAVGNGVRRIHSNGKAGAREGKFVRAVLFFLLAMGYWIALLMGTIGITALRRNLNAPIPEFWLIIPVEVIIVAAVLGIGYRMGQGGWRMDKTNEAAPDDAPVGDRTPDACWKMGMIYYNPNDPAAIVEKRFGIGWTLNFACPKSWILIGVLVLFMVGVLIVSLAATR